MHNLLKQQLGFTIVEMMVGVSLVGVMSAVAVPNYLKYQARARQAEARVSLSAIYAREKAYAAENLTYSACIVQLGVSSEPNRYYAYGFNPEHVTNSECGRTGNQPCIGYSWNGAVVDQKCETAPNSGVPDANKTAADATRYAMSTSGLGVANELNLGDADGPDTPAPLRTTQVSRIAFRAGATGKVSSVVSDFDRWYINDLQQVMNFDNGI